MKRKPLPYHTLFIEVEYDPTYWGGDYDDVGQTVLIPVSLVDAVGMKKAFKHVTGLSPKHIVHWSEDELCNTKAEPVEDWVDEFEASKAKK